MPKVVLFIATSLDGYIASSDGTVDWLFHDADYGYSEFMNSVDTVVMGSKTWEQAKTFEDVPFAGKKVIVFSHTHSDSNVTRIRFVQGNPSSVISEVLRYSQKDIWLVGGGQLVKQFIASNLIDEYRLFVHPIILGQGIPLFSEQPKRTDLSFVSSKSFSSGLVELRYHYLANKSDQDKGFQS
jgi:dihydrofolate reductase